MNDYQNWLTVIFSAVVALSTVVYAILTWKLVKETKAMRQLQVTPDISISLKLSETGKFFVYLIVENIGFGKAENVEFSILKDLDSYDDAYFKLNKGIFASGLRSFYPKQRFEYYLTDLQNNNKEKIKQSLIIKVTYSDIFRSKIERIFELNLSELSGYISLDPPDNYLGIIGFHLKGIAKNTKELSDYFKKLHPNENNSLK